MTRRAGLIEVMAEYRDLTMDGLAGHTRPDFMERRTELLVDIDQFERAVTWLSAVPRRGTPNKKDGFSYALKHIVQNWSGGYVSNGAFIAAALHHGFPIERCPSQINCWVGVAGRRNWPK